MQPRRLVEVDEIQTEPVRAEFGGADYRAAEESVRATFEEYQSRIYGMLLASSRDPELAADITQDAFIRLLGETRGGRAPDNPGAWLYRVALNLLVSRARRVQVARRFVHRLAVPDEASETPEHVALDREGSRELMAALKQLRLDERTALLMAAQGVSGEEIAAHLGRTHGATRTLMLRARRKLRRFAPGREDQR